MWLWDHPVVREIYMQWGSQVGKTILTYALISHTADNRPGPAFIAITSEDKLRDFFMKIYPMLENCKRVEPLLLPKQQRRFPVIDLRDMLVYGAWSGSVSRLGDVSARYLFMVELDKWDTDVSREADPEYLAGERRKAWPNYKILKDSTPTIRGQSRIERNLQNADVVLKYHVPCPHCREYQALKMGNGKRGEGGVMYDRVKDGKVDYELARRTAYYECVHCQGRIENHHRRMMLRGGVWAPEGHEIPPDCKSLVLWGKGGPVPWIGTHLSSLYSPLLDWPTIAVEYLRAQGSPKSLQNFINGWLAKTWSPSQNVPNWKKFGRTHESQYKIGVVPEDARVLTAGVDIHGKRWGNYYVILAILPGPIYHVVQTGVVDEPRENEFLRLAGVADVILADTFSKENGEAVSVRVALFDSGYNTGDVYRVCDSWGPRALPVKGIEGRAGAPVPLRLSDRDQKYDVRRGLKKRRRHLRGGRSMHLYDRTFWHAEINTILQRPYGEPYSLSLHAKPSRDYLRGICNVYPLAQKDNRGMEKMVWTVDDEEYGSHFRDATIYALAGAYKLKIYNLKKGARPPSRRKAAPPLPTPRDDGGRQRFRELDRR
jgi:phage terminase large subunit GpA-like protein